MGRSIVETVVDMLRRGGFRAERACPGKRMPEIQSIATAVQLVELDQEKATAKVQVSVLVPRTAGAAGAEDTATEIYRLLQSKGAICRQEKAEYLRAPEFFCTEVYATFSGQETSSGWVPIPPPQEPFPEPAPPTFSAAVNGIGYPYVVSFRGFRETSETAVEIEAAPWHFRLEEVYPLDASENPVPVSDFFLEVTRSERTEMVTGCVLTAQTREIRADGQHQIWEGTASRMTVS